MGNCHAIETPAGRLQRHCDATRDKLSSSSGRFAFERKDERWVRYASGAIDMRRGSLVEARGHSF